MTQKNGDNEPSARKNDLKLRAQLALALLPTATVLIVFALVNSWSRQRLLFASLASSSFLIYLDPEHKTNSTRTLVISQGWAAIVGYAAHLVFGAQYWGAGVAMVVVIFGMILARAMHPPAVSTAFSFALTAGRQSTLGLFALCVGLIVLLVILQRASVWLLKRVVGKNAAASVRNEQISTS